MRRLQIYINESLDAGALEHEARRQGTSKATLVRRAVSREYSSQLDDIDGWAALDGWLEGARVDDIDSAFYEPKQ